MQVRSSKIGNKGKVVQRIGDPRDMQVSKFEIEKEDIMKFKPLYEALFLFFKEEGYEHPLGGENPEDLYWEKWTPSGAKEQHFWWRMKKDATPYFRYLVILNMQTLNVTKAEVAYKSRKVSAEKTDIIIRGEIILQWDIKNQLQESIFEKFKNIFFNHTYRQEIEDRKIDLQNFSLRLQRMLKQYLEMTADAEAPQLFQGPMGYKDT